MSRSQRKTVTYVSFGVEYLHEWSVGGGGWRVGGRSEKSERALLSAQTIDGSGEGQILLARMSESRAGEKFLILGTEFLSRGTSLRRN